VLEDVDVLVDELEEHVHLAVALGPSRVARRPRVDGAEHADETAHRSAVA
jgi:hypothetical protein